MQANKPNCYSDRIKLLSPCGLRLEVIARYGEDSYEAQPGAIFDTLAREGIYFSRWDRAVARLSFFFGFDITFYAQ